MNINYQKVARKMAVPKYAETPLSKPRSPKTRDLTLLEVYSGSRLPFSSSMKLFSPSGTRVKRSNFSILSFFATATVNNAVFNKLVFYKFY